MANLKLSKAPEQLKKLKTFSKKALATIATTGSLLFSACSNNTSTRQQQEQRRQEQQNIKKEIYKKDNTIFMEKLDIATIIGQHDYLVDRDEKNVGRFNELVDEYNNFVDTYPERTQGAANRARSLDQLHDKIVETEKEISNLEDKLSKADMKLHKNTKEKTGLEARYQASLKENSNGHYQHMETGKFKKINP